MVDKLSILRAPQCLTVNKAKLNSILWIVKVLLGLHNSIAVGLIQPGPDTVQNQKTEVWKFSDLFDTTVLGFSMRL